MANLNKVMLIGRLTRDPEAKTFNNGGKVVNFGFAVNNRKKNQSTGQWEDEPVFLDVSAFNQGEHGKLADLVEQYLARGKQCYIEGYLRLEQWTDQEGNQHQKLKVIAQAVQFLEPRDQTNQPQDEEVPRSRPAYQRSAPAAARQEAGAEAGGEEDCPF